MTEIIDSLVQKLRQTSRCQPEAKKLAAAFAGVTASQYQTLIKQLIDSGEDRALGMLLIISAINEVKLDATVLVETLKFVEFVEDATFAFRFQDERAVEALIALTEAEGIDFERKAAVAQLATELTIQLKLDRQPIRKTWWKMMHKSFSVEIDMLIHFGLDLLDNDAAAMSAHDWLIHRDPLGSLPEERPHTIIGGDYSVRRPIPKIGRNDPCHCGSGKKYKKCCYEKDQEILRDASPYEGITMTQARSNPALVDDADLVRSLRVHELKRLDPTTLKDLQLVAAYHALDGRGLRDLAFAMLLELKNRPGRCDFALGHLEDLLYSTLLNKEAELSRRIMAEIPEKQLYSAEENKFHLSLLENPERLADLEALCRKSIGKEDDKDDVDYALTALSYDFENIYPALSIVFARAAIVSRPESILDNDMLRDVINNARIALDLEPWGDPIEEYFELLDDLEGNEFDDSDQRDEIEHIRKQALEAQKQVAQTTRELQNKEAEFERLLHKIEATPSTQPEQKVSAGQETAIPKEVLETIENLRRRLKNLKEEIKSQREVRLQLRQQLQEAQKKARSDEQKRTKSEADEEDESTPAPEVGLKKILIPEYTEIFRRNCESLPTPIVAKALRAVASFAAQDQTIWQQTKSLETMPGYYRIRIGIHYRLLLHWQPDVRLQCIDLIPRANLETWIKQHAT